MAKQMPRKGATAEVGARQSAVNGGQSKPAPAAAPAVVSLASSPFPPIADYAFLSDCEVNALIAPSGRLLCWVRTPEHNSLSVEVAGYKGPGAYTQGVTATNVAPLTVQRWTTTGADPAIFTVAAGQESGTMDVTMSDPVHTDRAKLTIKGSWSCVTGETSQL